MLEFILIVIALFVFVIAFAFLIFKARLYFIKHVIDYIRGN